MNPLSFVKNISQRHFIICLLLLSIFQFACGTFQVELATSPEPTFHTTGLSSSPTPNFDKPPFATEAGYTFDDRMTLVGFTMEPESAEPGSTIMITLIWQVTADISTNYNTFVHIVDAEERLLAQKDGPTGGGGRPSSEWIVNEYIYDQHQLSLPRGMTLDDVEIRVGLYDANEGLRLDVDNPNFVTISSVNSSTPSLTVSPTPNESALDQFTPTATETPQIEDTPTDPLQDSLAVRVAYVKDANVWTWDSESGSEQLTVNGGIENVWLSEDGQQFAFLRGQDVWVVDGDSMTEHQLTTAADFEGLSLGQELAPFVTSVVPYQIAWRPASHQLFFNTSPQLEGPGLFLSDDLWMVDSDTGELTMILGPGEGGNFTFSPDGKYIAIVTPGRIDLMDIDGNNRREAFTHTPVITFSEFEYYSQPVWAADSASLRVSIPPSDSSADSAQPTSIWYIPIEDQPARLIGQVTISPGLYTPLMFAPNLARLVYLVGEQHDDDPNSNLPSMAVSEMSDSKIWNPILIKAEVKSIYGWSPDGMRLFYASPTASIAEITMGQPDSRPLVSDDGQTIVLNVNWVDNFRYLYLQQNSNGWDILLGLVDGSAPVIIDSVTGFPPAFDFAWLLGMMDQ